jgi:hypothetical protein
MLVTNERIREDIPHEPADEDAGTEQQWMEFERQPWGVLHKARLKKSRESMANASALGPDVIEAFAKRAEEEESPDPEVETPDGQIVEARFGLEQFDLGILLENGIKAWSYGKKVSSRLLARLDEETAEWAGERIVELSRPATKDEEGNDSGDSIAA